VAAGRRHRKLRGPLTDEGRERLRQSAINNRPWEHSTGPKTQKGKARSAANGCKRQKGKKSKRQIKATVADASSLMEQMNKLRRSIEG